MCQSVKLRMKIHDTKKKIGLDEEANVKANITNKKIALFSFFFFFRIHEFFNISEFSQERINFSFEGGGGGREGKKSDKNSHDELPRGG